MIHNLLMNVYPIRDFFVLHCLEKTFLMPWPIIVSSALQLSKQEIDALLYMK